jgi:Kef-type K+ transport system membrane component KefB/mannitol/fructose-specific phosphotransferase system IIA component (Ntr-type)
MSSLTHDQVLVMLLGLAALLGAARVLGEVARRFGQPTVVGEILAGILLGPTILGAIAPAANAFLFPTTGPNALVLHGLTTFSVVLFLVVAGMEVDLSTIIRLKRSAAIIGCSSLLIPFSIGATLGYVVPIAMGREPDANALTFALFLGVAMSISALPVIAKTLMDLNLFRTDLGMMVIATAIFLDLVGWTIFAVVLGMMSPSAPGGPAGSIAMTITVAVGFAVAMLTLGRWAFHRSLPWIQANSSWPMGVLAFALTVALLAAAATEAIGIHAIFGAFLTGVALGDSPHMREKARRTLEQFVASVFAPLFFASIGLKVNFLAHFDGVLVLTVVGVACVGQILGGTFGAKLAGFPPRHAWSIGFALNARGAMEIVLATLAMQAGLIGERLFVALVVMAIFTSLLAGPAIQRILKRRKPTRFAECITSKGFVGKLQGGTPEEAVRELSAALSRNHERLIPDDASRAVLDRERIMPTGLANGVAVPHARLAALDRPIVAVGIAKDGIDFRARDGQPSRLIFLVLTPEGAAEAQLELLAEIAKTFGDRTVARAALDCRSFTEFMALLNTGAAPESPQAPRSVSAPAAPKLLATPEPKPTQPRTGAKNSDQAPSG